MHPEPLHLLKKLCKMGIEGEFVYVAAGAGFYVDEGDIPGNRHALFACRMVLPGVDINQVSLFPEFSGEFADIDAHAAGVFGAKLSKRAGVHTEHSDS
jgi:hypothetical protein